jgi:hypothetical protein
MANIDDIAINNDLNKLISDNNIFYPERQGFIKMSDKVYSKLKEFQRDYNLELNSFIADPLFLNIYDNDFSLDPNSPAINAGRFVGLQQDYYGNTIPLGDIPDIGLIELNNVAVNPTSLMNQQQYDATFDFQIYPNPSLGIFSVAFKNNNTRTSRITIKDLSGKTVFESSYKNEDESVLQIDVSNLYKGIYIVSVCDNTRLLSQPIIIQ